MTLLTMGLLLLLTLAGLCVPWMRRAAAPAARDARTAANVAVYRQRIHEIEADRAASLIDAETAESLREEQAARLVGDVGGAVVKARSARWPWVVVMLAVPVATGALYFGSERWSLAQQIEQARVDPGAAQALAISAGRDQLTAHLRRQPDDAEAWASLGEIELASGNPRAAATAYAQATSIEPDRGAWWAAEGEALALHQQQDLRGAPRERFERALSLSPNDGKALFYAGLAAAQEGDLDLASAHWQRLTQRDDLPDPVRRVVQAGLDQWGAGASAAASTEALGVRFEISLDPTQGPPDSRLSSLMVFVRDHDQPGMPLAARKLPISGAWPLQVELSVDDWLSEAEASLAGRDLHLVARLSEGRTVEALPGDWSAEARVPAASLPISVTLTLVPAVQP